MESPFWSFLMDKCVFAPKGHRQDDLLPGDPQGRTCVPAPPPPPPPPPGASPRGAAMLRAAAALSDGGAPHRYCAAAPPSSRTDWTRLVPPPVLTGHVSSKVLSPPAQPRVLNVRRQSPGGAPPAATVGARGGLVGLHASRGGSGSDSTPVGAGAGSLARPWEPGRGRGGGGSGDGGGALVGGEATSPGKV